MPSPLADRVASRFHSRTATIAYQDRDFGWGWFTRDVPARMHLTLINQEHRGCIVWLEDRGQRIFSARRCPSGSTIPLARWVWNNRESIEQRWLEFMQTKGWLSVRVETDQLVVVCYSGEETEFTRPIGAAVWTERPSSPDADSRSARRTR